MSGARLPLTKAEARAHLTTAVVDRWRAVIEAAQASAKAPMEYPRVERLHRALKARASHQDPFPDLRAPLQHVMMSFLDLAKAWTLADAVTRLGLPLVLETLAAVALEILDGTFDGDAPAKSGPPPPELPFRADIDG